MQQRTARRWYFGFIAVALSYILISGVAVHLTKNTPTTRVLEDQQFVGSSGNWFDRQACRWLGLCGTWHLNSREWTWPHSRDDFLPPGLDWRDFWTSGENGSTLFSEEETRLREIPDYVLEHAPYVHLFSGEEFWPGDIAEHLVHVAPHLNYEKIVDLGDERNLTNLDELNHYRGADHGRSMYLKSNDNVEERPAWLVGEKNIPSTPRKDAGTEADSSWVNTGGRLETDGNSPGQGVIDGGISISSESASPNGRCGGSSGYTCRGSQSGKCCSIYGWCGNSDEYCGGSCNPLAGQCTRPQDVHGPHTDLRRGEWDSARHKPQRVNGGRSSAPAILVTVPKEDGILDAFWFFFYSFNLGQRVVRIRFGNHVGDWEHTVVRFRHGKPEQIFLSEHFFGQAFTWKAIEKYVPSDDGSGTMLGSWSNTTATRVAKRPVVYSAIGTHAMYGTPGLHPYALPYGLLHDETDRGPLWDPALNFKSFTYDAKNQIVRASTLNPSAPTGWFHFAGHWGDKHYPLSDPRQYRFAGQYHYVNGPTGPKFKNLGRTKICQGKGECHIRDWLGPDGLPGLGRDAPDDDGEEGGIPGGNVTDEAW